MKAYLICGRSHAEKFNDSRMQNLAMLRDIQELLDLPRCQSCTQSSNIALANACDSAGLSPSKKSLERLKSAIANDKRENPHHWSP
jgi:hypothetical protein